MAIKMVTFNITTNKNFIGYSYLIMAAMHERFPVACRLYGIFSPETNLYTWFCRATQ